MGSVSVHILWGKTLQTTLTFQKWAKLQPAEYIPHKHFCQYLSIPSLDRQTQVINEMYQQ